MCLDRKTQCFKDKVSQSINAMQPQTKSPKRFLMEFDKLITKVYMKH